MDARAIFRLSTEACHATDRIVSQLNREVRSSIVSELAFRTVHMDPDLTYILLTRKCCAQWCHPSAVSMHSPY